MIRQVLRRLIWQVSEEKRCECHRLLFVMKDGKLEIRCPKCGILNTFSLAG